MSRSSEATISKSEYARHRGCAPSAVTRALREGRITATADGRINVKRADKQWADLSRARGDSGVQAPAPAPPAAPPVAPPQELAYADSRARREHFAAKREELELDKAAGKLIDRETVNRVVFEVFRAIRDRVMAVPRRCAGALQGLDVREAEQMLTDELRGALGPDEAKVVAALPWKAAP